MHGLNDPITAEREKASDSKSIVSGFRARATGQSIVKSIALVSPAWPPEAVHNGIVSYVSQLQPALMQRGCDARIVSKRKAAEFPANAAESVRPWRPTLCRAVNAVARRVSRHENLLNGDLIGLCHIVRQLSRTYGVELVEVEESFGEAEYLTKKLPVPVIVRLHGPWFLVGPANGVIADRAFSERVARERIAIASAAGVSAPSRAVLDAARKFYQLELRHARVIPNPITPRNFPVTRQVPRGDEPAMLFVGRFDRLKGGDIVLRAFNQVVERFPSARCVFIGPDRGLACNGTNALVGLRDFVSQQLSPAAQRNVEWLGEQSPEGIERYRQSAAATVVASRFENFPYALIEAMRSGSPVVAARTGGIPEIVHDGETGLLFESENAGELAQAISRLFENREFASRLGKNAAADVAARFDPALIAEQTLDFYGEVVARWKGRA